METTSLPPASSYMARHTQHKSSTPIEIPSVRRAIARRPPISRTPSTSIIGATSPEQLVFHMSPDCAFRYSPNLMIERERFMYPYPTITAPTAHDVQSELSTKQCLSSSPEEVETVHTPPSYHTRFIQATARCHPHYHRLGAPAIRTTPLRKITGFKPMLPSQLAAPASQEPASPSVKETCGHLEPPPPRASLSSPPWMFPGMSEATDVDVGSPEAVPVVDFGKYLMNRIDNLTMHSSFSGLRKNVL